MATLIILASLPDNTPYLQYYIDILEKNNLKYNVIGWNRRGQEYKKNEKFIVYNVPTNDYYPFWKKILEIHKYYNYVINHLSHNTYDNIIICTISISLYMQRYLSKHYKKRYIFDIRDYSPIMKFGLGRKIVKRLLLDSALNCISSYGFKKWLPPNIEYVISHNIRKCLLNNNIPYRPINHKNIISILTIGSIRDEYSNSMIISALGNDPKFNLNFVGYGNAIHYLKNYVEARRLTNIKFWGAYKKEDEPKFVTDTDLINIYLPNNILSNCLLSNRFYLSLLYKKPMIVNDGCIQADLVSKYDLGIIIKKDEDIKTAIINYIDNFDINKYLLGNRILCNIIKKEIEYFENRVYDTIKTHISH